MAHLRTKLVAAFSLKRNSTANTSALPVKVPAPSSPRDIAQPTAVPGAVGSVSPNLVSPSPAVRESTPDADADHTHAKRNNSAFLLVGLRWRRKVFAAVSRPRSTTTPTTYLISPEHLSVRYIGPAILVSGFVAAAPVHAVSLPATAFDSALDNNVDLSKAKQALRVLSALGDGIAGVPWLKGAAELGLEIVNTLDNVQSNKSDCRELALRICQFLILVHQGNRPGHEHEPKHIAEFQRDLYRILHTVKTISSYKSYRRLLKADDIKQQIFNCNQMVNHSRDIFLVAAHVAQAQAVRPATSGDDREALFFYFKH